LLTNANTRDLTNTDSDSNGYRNRDGYSDIHGYSNCHGYRYLYSYSNSHGNRYAYAHAECNPTTYTQAKVEPSTRNSANSAATPVVVSIDGGMVAPAIPLARRSLGEGGSTRWESRSCRLIFGPPGEPLPVVPPRRDDPPYCGASRARGRSLYTAAAGRSISR
jgi:hypothetical protein